MPYGKDRKPKAEDSRKNEKQTQFQKSQTGISVLLTRNYRKNE